jgi:septum formation protein
MKRPRLILASASARREALLADLGVEFEVCPSDLPEAWPQGSPRVAVELLARAKAQNVARRLSAGVVLGADTAVILGGEVFGKPRDHDDARRMLRALRGRVHEVITGVALVNVETLRESVTSVVTRVAMRPYDDAEIEQYIASGEPFDKAGAYAIQGRGGALVASVDGCYTNVIGLPMTTTRKLLESWGLLKSEA